MPVPCLRSACSENAAPPHVGAALGTSGGATQKKGIRGSFDIIGTFYSSGHYTLTFLEWVSASSSVSVENVHLQNGVDCLALWSGCHGHRKRFLQHKASLWGLDTRDCSVQKCLLDAPLRSQWPASLLGCSEPRAQPGMHMLWLRVK